MASKKKADEPKNPQTPKSDVSTLVTALAAKGGQGIIFLCIIFVTIWGPFAFGLIKFFGFFESLKDISGNANNGVIFAAFAVGLLCLAYLAVAYFLTSKVLGMIIPTMKAEADVNRLMSEALGGRVVTTIGTFETMAIDRRGAELRTKQIMKVLLERAKRVLGVELVRSNIFTLNDKDKLNIFKDFHLNMDGPMVNVDELTISIPSGCLSSGRAYKYFRPVLSIKTDGKWPYSSDADIKEMDLQNEVQKAHPDLKWITSMPIPYKVKPFKLVCGVLNLDGLRDITVRDQLVAILADLSTAAALIAVLNRSTGFLEGKYSKPVEPDKKDQEQWREFMINPEEFDPATCPEPSVEFVQALSSLQGLEFFAKTSPTEVANFLRNQLR